jgi:integrase
VAETKHEMFDGRLHVYKRERSSFWQCSAFIDDRNWRTSTRTDSLAEAKDFAEDWYLGLRGKFKAGILKHEKKFREVADVFKEEYSAITEGERNQQYVEGHWRRLKLHLNPFFGEMGLSEIKSANVTEYRIKRRKELIKGRGTAPTRSTLHKEIVTLRQVLKTAVLHGWIDSIPNLSEPYKKAGKFNRRAWFNPDEYKQLYTATRERAKNPIRKSQREHCEDLHDRVLFMVNTGLRPDEAIRLQFRDVRIIEDGDTRETILHIDVRGKRGTGYCKSMPGAVLPFQRILARRNQTIKSAATSDASVFPVGHTELFNAILEEQKLKVDRDGQSRSMYSLRHTYISMRLMEGADIYQIAKNCRTSVEMIEKHYAAHIKNMLDASAINVRRAKSKSDRVVETPVEKVGKKIRRFTGIKRVSTMALAENAPVANVAARGRGGIGRRKGLET